MTSRQRSVSRSVSTSEKSKTKVWGSLTSTLWSVFRQNSDEEHHLHFSKLRPACNALDLFPSTSQVHEMLMCAIEYGSPCKADHITFGEFCVLVAELRSYYHINPRCPVPYSLVKVRSETNLPKKKRRESLAHFEGIAKITFEQLCEKMYIMRLQRAWIQMTLHICAVSSGSILFAIKAYKCYRNYKRTVWILMRLCGCAGLSGSMLVANTLCMFSCGAAYWLFWYNCKSAVPVFLGGSCNPTRWRSEIAIPFFKDHGITFYNPQVQHWKPELMELEAQAKQMADYLFFVIDNKTRAISSMIEVAYLVANQRQVVVTMCEYKDENIEIDGQLLSDSEMLDLIKGRLILTDLVERNSVPVFPDIDNALKCTHQILSQGIHVQDLKLKDGALPVRHGHLKLGRALLELREAFNSVDSNDFGFLTSKDVCLAYKSCTGEDLDTKWLKQKRKVQDEFVYEEFCAIVTEHRAQVQSPGVFQRFLSQVLQPFKWLFSKFSPPVEVEEDYPKDEIRDVYLGGSAGDIQWRPDVVIPILRKHGLSFVDPAVHDWDQKLIPIHVALRENCRLLFYVITGDRRSLGSMCEAGYYIGKGCRMVLCIQKIPKDAVISGDKLTEQSVKDYNRGRDYLCDLASREGVPLFEDVQEAINCVIFLLTEQSPCQ